jgi:hypothetical protein
MTTRGPVSVQVKRFWGPSGDPPSASKVEGDKCGFVVLSFLLVACSAPAADERGWSQVAPLLSCVALRGF